MPSTDVKTALVEAQKDTIQHDPEVYGGSGNVRFVPWFGDGASTVAPWWSPVRDVQLRIFWKRVDHLAGAIYTMTSKMSAIPWKFKARDTSIKAHVEQAKILTDIVANVSEMGGGWVEFYQKYVEDIITQDNGGFAEIIGPGDPAGAMVGQPVALRHLDSARCTRTGNSQYPVLFQDIDGHMYKLHHSRVMFTSQMTSPIREMFGVGVCAVSRFINIGQSLLDILIYKQEKMGSRPFREVIITKGGLDPKDLTEAFAIAESQMDAMGFRRYSKVVVGGSSTLPEASAERLTLSDLPDGFSESDTIIYGMALVAMCLGMDARELFPAMSAGATRADALLQHLKQRGKGPGQIIQSTEQSMFYKFCPPYLEFIFDYQDDAEDRQRADTRLVRSNARVQDTTTGALTERVMRERMFEDGDINQAQFERLELESGRLPNGDSVLTLFYLKNREISRYLDLGVSDPLDIEANGEELAKEIKAKQREIMEILANANSPTARMTAMQAQSALKYLLMAYQNGSIEEVMVDKPAQSLPVDPRQRRQDLRNPTTGDMSTTPTETSHDNPDKLDE